MFSGHKPVYFTFSGEGETFFLDGLLRMKLKDYLWYQLHRCGYRYIIFITLSAGNKVELFIPDKESFAANRYGQGVFSQKTLWSVKGDDPAAKNRLTASRTAAYEWMIYKLAEENTAVVMDIETLDALCPKTFWDRAGALTQALHTEKGTLVLTAPMEISREELALYVGKSSLFSQLSSRRAACMPLYEISASPQEKPVFEELMQSLPEQVLELGCLSADRLMPMLRQVEFARDEDWSSNEFYDILNFLLYWLYNEDVKRDSGGLFGSIKGSITAGKLYDALTGDGMTALRERIRVQRQIYFMNHPKAGESTSLQMMLRERYGPKPQPHAESRVVLDEHILSMVSGIAWPEEYKKCESDFHFVRVEKADWEQMQRDVRKPYNKKLEDARMRPLQKYSDALRRARVKNDPETVCRAGNMLMFIASNMYTASDEQYEDYLKNGEAYIQASEQYHETERVLRTLKAQGSGHGSSVVYEAAYMSHEANLGKYRGFLQLLDNRLIYTGKLPEKFSDDLINISNEIITNAEEEIHETPVNEAVSTVPSMFGGTLPEMDTDQLFSSGKTPQSEISFAVSGGSKDPSKLVNDLKPARKEENDYTIGMSEEDALKILRGDNTI